MENTRKGKMDVRQIVARQYALLTEDPSNKLQASSNKLQASSAKRATLCHIDTICSGATLCRIDTRCRGATLCLMDQGPRMWYYDNYNKTKRAHMRSSMRAVSQPRDISGHKPPYTCEKRLMIRLVAQCTCPGASYSLTCDKSSRVNMSY